MIYNLENTNQEATLKLNMVEPAYVGYKLPKKYISGFNQNFSVSNCSVNLRY